NEERGAAIGGGIVGGGLIGALLGHAVCDPEKEAPPPPPAPAPPPPPPPPGKAEPLVTLHGPQFDFNKATLKPAGKKMVDAAAAGLPGPGRGRGRLACPASSPRLGGTGVGVQRLLPPGLRPARGGRARRARRAAVRAPRARFLQVERRGVRRLRRRLPERDARSRSPRTHHDRAWRDRTLVCVHHRPDGLPGVALGRGRPPPGARVPARAPP